jgi:hypothetical protein
MEVCIVEALPYVIAVQNLLDACLGCGLRTEFHISCADHGGSSGICAPLSSSACAT